MDIEKIETKDTPDFENMPGSYYSRKHGHGLGFLVSVILLAFLAGSVSGFLSSESVVKKAKQNSSSLQNIKVQEDSAVIDVVKKASPAVVSIVISKDLNQYQQNNNPFAPFFFSTPSNTPSTQPDFQKIGAGTGFFVTSNGLIVTNKHVVEDQNAKYTVVDNNGKQYDAKVLSVDPVNDIALVKIDIKGAPTLAFADSGSLEIGQHVIAIGNSLGQFSNTVTSGIISGIGRTVTAGSEYSGSSEDLEDVIQTDAAINPGNSGGPLLNIGGEVVGMNTATSSEGQLLGFAIPANDVSKDVASFNKFARISKPYLGIRYVLLNQGLKEQNNLPVEEGAWIAPAQQSGDTPVISGGPADKAGVKAGDIITAVNNDKITKTHSLAGILKNFNPSDTITLTVLRDGKTMTINVTLGENK
jgi:serine protease Do